MLYPRTVRREMCIITAMPFREMDHTADLAFEIEGGTLEELFQEAARALVGVLIRHPETIRPQKHREVHCQEPTLEDALHCLLSEIIFLLDAYGEVYAPETLSISVGKEGVTVQGNLAGEDFDPERHGMNHHVKSVTYHELSVEKTSEGYRAFVILDV